MYSDLKQKLCDVMANLKDKSENICFDEYFITVRSETDDCFAMFKKGTTDFNQNEVILVDGDLRLLEEKNVSIDERFFTHYLLYKTYPFINCIVHSDSKWLSVWSAMGVSLCPVTLLHSKNFFGEIVCVDSFPLKKEKMNVYLKMGLALLDKLKTRFPYQTPAIFVRGMGAFVWGDSVESTINKLRNLEKIVERTYLISQNKFDNFSCLPYEVQFENYFSLPNSKSLDEPIEKVVFNENWIKNCQESIK